MKKRKNFVQEKKFSKWCKKICQTIRNHSGFPVKERLQLHFLRNPQKKQPGLCVDYTTQKIFEVFSDGKVVQIGTVKMDGTNKNIMKDILEENYYLI